MKNLWPAVVSVSLLSIWTCGPPPPPNDQPNWHVKENAVDSETHPLGGFWHGGSCENDAGLAIGPVGPDTYYVSFCGPGGCFAEGTYRPETRIVDDPTYRLTPPDTLEVEGWLGTWSTFVRCPKESSVGNTTAPAPSR
jgi:hypothetical protein